MKDYLSIALRLAAEGGVFAATSVLKEFAADQQSLRKLVENYIRGIATADSDELIKVVANNTLVLNPEDLSEPSHGHVMALSAHKKGTSGAVSSHVVQSILTPLNGPVLVEQYKLPNGWDSTFYDPDVKVSNIGTRTIYPGEVLEIHADEIIHAFNFPGPTVLLKLQSVERKHYCEWSFDRITGEPFQLISSHASESYIQNLCAAIGTMSYEAASPTLDHLLSHDKHNIRWAAAQALGLIDRHHGIRALRILSDDAHAQIRSAAIRILKQNELAEN